MMTVFPLGHPVEIDTLSTEVRDIAERRWGRADRVFDVKPLRFSVCVVDGPVVGEPRFEPNSHGFKFVANGCESSFDRRSREGGIRSTRGSLETMMEATILTGLTWTFFVGVHAGCVMWGGRSVLLCGDSGAGKSTLAFGCGLEGWTVVSDNSLYWAEAPHDVLVSPGGPVKLRDGARAMFGELAEARLETATVAPPGPLVFLERRSGSFSAWPKAEDEVLAYMTKYGTRPDREYTQGRHRMLLRQGAWTLEYEHVEDAVAWLGSIT